MSITRIVERLDHAPQGSAEQLFDAALDSVIAMDGSGRIVAWNRAAEACFGWKRHEALGLQLSETIIPEEYRAAHHSGLDRYRETGTGPVINARVEVVALRRDGSEFPVELTIVPIETAEGEIFYAFLRDITDRKQAEQLTKRRALEAQVLYEATSLIPRGGSADELFERCLQNICELTGWSVGHVLRSDPPEAAERLVSTDIWYFGANGPEGIRSPTGAYSFRRGQGMPGRVWASGEPAWIEDIERDPDFPRQDFYLRHGLRSAFAFPVYLEGRLEAVLEFFSPLTQKPDEVLLLVARSLAVQLGPVLERKRAVEHREILVRELDHRVANVFAVIKSIFRRTAAHAEGMTDMMAKFEGRLDGLLRAHRALTKDGGTRASLREVVAAALAPFGGDTSDAPFDLEGPDVLLPARSATDLSMVLHELATNATKHGALSVPSGRLLVAWQLAHDARAPRVRIEWRESGGPRVVHTGHRGYGSVLIESLMTRSLGGSCEQRLDEAGLTAVLDFPLHHTDD